MECRIMFSPTWFVIYYKYCEISCSLQWWSTALYSCVVIFCGSVTLGLSERPMPSMCTEVRGFHKLNLDDTEPNKSLLEPGALLWHLISCNLSWSNFPQKYQVKSFDAIDTIITLLWFSNEGEHYRCGLSD